jgi:hypothetical protein
MLKTPYHRSYVKYVPCHALRKLVPGEADARVEDVEAADVILCPLSTSVERGQGARC